MTQTKEEKAEYHKKWYQAHKKEQQARSKAYRKLHIEERKAYGRAYFDSHGEERRLYREKPEIKEKMKAYSKKWREENKDHIKFEMQKKYSTNPYYQKMKKVHFLTNQAIRKGEILRRSCVICGEKKAQAHHCDYNKPFDITWLCKKCHTEWHKKNKPLS